MRLRFRAVRFGAPLFEFAGGAVAGAAVVDEFVGFGVRGFRDMGLRFAVFVFFVIGAMVVDEFVFCADTTNPALANAVKATMARPRTKR